MLSIVTTPDPVLRAATQPVTKVDKKLLDLIRDMSKALVSAKDPEGVGLAAPQVGVPLRLFLIRPDLTKPPRLFINPEITHFSQRQQIPESKKGVYEGCLSLPHYYAPIRRSLSVTVKYQTLDLSIMNSLSKSRVQNFQKKRAQPDAGNDQAVEHDFLKFETDPANPKLIQKTENFSGLTAHIIQHEMDHLNGILFIDHVLSQNTKLLRIHGKIWEEVEL